MKIYKTRYYANKEKRGGQVTVKVCGGYMLMSAADYIIWRKQR